MCCFLRRTEVYPTCSGILFLPPNISGRLVQKNMLRHAVAGVLVAQRCIKVGLTQQGQEKAERRWCHREALYASARSRLRNSSCDVLAWPAQLKLGPLGPSKKGGFLGPRPWKQGEARRSDVGMITRNFNHVRRARWIAKGRVGHQKRNTGRK